ncbi:MAG: glycosyltransferase family 2 protein [Pigmentiphaga sp.]|uniref:glycosyltransferase family 2 protein n=1 Tax=Pigmentiphaga sp. TaxID=1977564 RepID=UPI0029AC273F|nr:glycosyltransferase family 2 protein [Pigmentiphaga sp.]MDX3905550.1 glycosyltransferase family 2 protein [Pigmentiphaga sp.]
MERIPVSVVVMTKNEARNIVKCLASLQRFSEVFVVDSESTDDTRDLALDQGARVVPFKWNGKYPKKKQWCLDNLPFSHRIVLYVDADEEMTPELAEEIRTTLPRFNDGHAGAFAAFDYVFCGKTLRHGHRVYKLVLLDRERARFLDYDDLDVANMWEVEGHYQPHVEGPTFVLSNRMIHADHDSLYHYFDKHNRYSDWEANLRLKGLLNDPREANIGGRAASKKLFQNMPFKGVAAFLHSYVLRRGFLDGKAGFDYAVARGLYYWQIGIKTEELKSASARANTVAREASSPGMERRPL